MEQSSDERMEQKLVDALTMLLNRKSLSKTSISEILKEAGVSRSSFYRKYRDKYDLLNSSYQHLLDDTLCQVTAGMSYKEATIQLYDTLREKPVFFKRAFAENGPESLRTYIYDRCYLLFYEIMESQGMDLKKKHNRMLLDGYLSGAMEVTCRWAAEGMEEDGEEMFKVMFQLMPHDMQTCFALYYM